MAAFTLTCDARTRALATDNQPIKSNNVSNHILSQD